MDALALARWQFGITTLYHFLFVPLTIGLSLTVAVMQTLWVRTGHDAYRRMTRMFGKLFLINFALGVVTGIVQEFQFGMNWSAYSRFVGDVFGAPLAMEALIAFFLESTFLGVWLFGWDRLPKLLHLASIWLVAIGSSISAGFILAANSWMQNPVGYRFNPTTGRAELHDVVAVFTNKVFLVTLPHTLLGSYLAAGLFVLAVSAWHLLRGRSVDVFSRASRIALVLSFAAAVGVAFTGHAQAQVMTEVQPMKMAAAEALWETERSAGFSLFAVGDIENGRNHINVTVPWGLSILATNRPDGVVQGINDVQAEYVARFGPGSYLPVVGVTYWTFRLMVGAGLLLGLFTALGLLLLRLGRFDRARWFHRLAVWAFALPVLGNLTGWVFTEMGRQPWAVFGLLRTADGVSPSVGAASVWTSMIGLTLLYGALAVAEVWLLLHYIRKGPDEAPEAGTESEQALVLSY
jgi:cytochrome d ubiquinol oxidase subunit I